MQLTLDQQLRVLDRAGHACECTGQCGAEHACFGGRCGVKAGSTIRRSIRTPAWWVLASVCPQEPDSPWAQVRWGVSHQAVVVVAAPPGTTASEAGTDLKALCSWCYERWQERSLAPSGPLPLDGEEETQLSIFDPIPG